MKLTNIDYVSYTKAEQNKDLCYLSAVPCKHGHLGLRYTRSMSCVECSKNRKPTPRPYKPIAPAKKKQSYNRWKETRYEDYKPRKNELRNARRKAAKESDPEWVAKQMAKALKKEQASIKAQEREAKKVASALKKEAAALRKAEREKNKRTPEEQEEWDKAYRKAYAKMDKQRIKHTPGFKLRKQTQMANRRAREKGAEGKHTTKDIRRIYDNQKGKCVGFGCGVDISNGRYCRDHIIALANGGSNWPENIQLLCPPCNVDKGSLTEEQWLEKILAREARSLPEVDVSHLLLPPQQTPLPENPGGI